MTNPWCQLNWAEQKLGLGISDLGMRCLWLGHRASFASAGLARGFYDASTDCYWSGEHLVLKAPVTPTIGQFLGCDNVLAQRVGLTVAWDGVTSEHLYLQPWGHQANLVFVPSNWLFINGVAGLLLPKAWWFPTDNGWIRIFLVERFLWSLLKAPKFLVSKLGQTTHHS